MELFFNISLPIFLLQNYTDIQSTFISLEKATVEIV